MSKVLVIVESPAKARTIEKFLGKRYLVKASMGHVRDLPKSQFGVDVDKDFEPKYINIRGKGDIIKELRGAAKKAGQILLAADPDREGEAIAWHLQHLLKMEPDTPCRIEFNEITKTAIKNAVKHPRSIDNARVDAQQARRILDRVVGYQLSPLLWRKIKRGLSAGRVQSVAVRLICEREKEIQDFKVEEYWSLTSLLDAGQGKKTQFPARLMRKNGAKLTIPKEEVMQEILTDLAEAEFKAIKIVRREVRRNPAPPFITSTLQQEAYRKLNFTVRRTMRVAQQLYEGLNLGPEGTVGLISYIRTDSTRVSSEIQQQTREYIKQRFGTDFVPAKPRQFKTQSKAQDAHESIRPTDVKREPDALKDLLSSEQYRLYRLIWERFVASQMRAAILAQTRIDIEAKGKHSTYDFRANGSIVKFPGFMQVYVEGRDEEDEEMPGLLPEIEEGKALKVVKMEPKQHFTQPPPRYGEATLVKALEEKRIGRPSTYAPIIETIVSRGYVNRQGKQFIPTELGILVVDMLKQYFSSILNVEFTAAMEEQLDRIEEGELSWKQVIRDFYFPFKENLDLAEAEIGRIEISDEITEEPCPQCGRFMVIKRGPFGRFLACPGFPECRTTKPILEEIGVNCPLCAGQIVVRHSKKGRRFYGCSNFPACKYVAWQMPTNIKCPECGSLLGEKTGKNKKPSLICTNRDCKHEMEYPKESQEKKAPSVSADAKAKTNEKDGSFA